MLRRWVERLAPQSFYIGAYWGSRPESAESCGRRLADCLAGMAEIDDALSSWFRKGKSKAAAKESIATDAESLADLLARERNRRDVDGSVIDGSDLPSACGIGVQRRWQ